MDTFDFGEYDEETLLALLADPESQASRAALKIVEDYAKMDIEGRASLKGRQTELYLPYRVTDEEVSMLHKLFPEYATKNYGASAAITSAYAADLAAAVTKSLTEYCDGGKGTIVVYGGNYLCDILAGVNRTHHCFDLANPIDNVKVRTLVLELSNVLLSRTMRMCSKLAAIRFLLTVSEIPHGRTAEAVASIKATLPPPRVAMHGRVLSARDMRENALREQFDACNTFDELLAVVNNSSNDLFGANAYEIPSHCVHLGSCTCAADNVIVNHNAKLISVYQVAAVMRAHGAKRCYGAFYFDPMMLKATRGNDAELGLTWNVVGEDLLMYISGDCQPFVTYKRKEYILLALVNKFCYEGRIYAREICRNKRGIWNYVMYELDETPEVFGSYAHKVYFPEETETYQITSFRRASNNYHRLDPRAYETVVMNAPKDIIDYAWSYSLVTKNLKYQDVLGVLRHRNERCVINAATAKTPSAQIDAGILDYVALAIFAECYCKRWSDSQVLAIIKEKNPDYKERGCSRLTIRWFLMVASYLTTQYTAKMHDKVGEVYKQYTEAGLLDFSIEDYDNCMDISTIGVKLEYGDEYFVQTETMIRSTFRTGMPGYVEKSVYNKYVWSCLQRAFYACPTEAIEEFERFGVTLKQAYNLCDMYFNKRRYALLNTKCEHGSILQETMLKYGKVTHDACGMGGLQRCHHVEDDDDEFFDCQWECAGEVHNMSDRDDDDDDSGGDSDSDDEFFDSSDTDVTRIVFRPASRVTSADTLRKAQVVTIRKKKPIVLGPTARKLLENIANTTAAFPAWEDYEEVFESPFRVSGSIMRLLRAAAPATEFVHGAAQVIDSVMAVLKPELMTTDPSWDQGFAYYGDMDVQIGCNKMYIDLAAREPLQERRRILPALATPSLRVRQADQNGALAAIINRNLSVEKIFADQDSTQDLLRMAVRWGNGILRQDWWSEVTEDHARKVRIATDDTAQRLTLITESDCADLLGLDPDFDLFVKNLTKYKGMLKSQVKPQTDRSMCSTVPGPQVIVYQGKDVSIPASAAFQEIQRRILRLLKPNVMWMTGKNRDEMNEFLATHQTKGGIWTESDFSKFDKNQQFRPLRFEYFIYFLFGLDVSMLQQWIKGNLGVTISTNVGIMLVVLFQRKSGSSTTLLGNNLVTTGAVTNVFDCSLALIMVIMGDDFAMKLEVPPVLSTSDLDFMLLFGLTAKTFNEVYGYFASCYIVENVDPPCFMADPMKRPHCFRDIAVMTRHNREGGYTHTFDLEERRVSLLDTLNGYQYDDHLQALAHCVVNRTGNANLKGHSGLVHLLGRALYTLAAVKEEFAMLYDTTPTVVMM